MKPQLTSKSQRFTYERSLHDVPQGFLDECTCKTEFQGPAQRWIKWMYIDVILWLI